MAKVQNGEEIFMEASTPWVGCTNITDDRQMTDEFAIAKTRMYSSDVRVKTTELKLMQLGSNMCYSELRKWLDLGDIWPWALTLSVFVFLGVLNSSFVV